MEEALDFLNVRAFCLTDQLNPYLDLTFIHFTPNELLRKAKPNEIIVWVDFQVERDKKWIDEILNSSQFNVVLLFTKYLSHLEKAQLIRDGVYAVFPEEELNNLDKIITEVESDRVAFKTLYYESKYQDLINKNIDEIIFEFEASKDSLAGWTLNYISPQIKKLCGIDSDTFLKTQSTYFDQIHPDDRGKLTQATIKALKKRVKVKREYRFKHQKKGTYTWVQDYIYPVIDAKAGTTHFYGIARNIQKDKESAQLLKEANDFSQNLIDTSPNILYLLDYETQLMTHGLKKFANYFGFEEQEILDMPNGVYSLIHPEDEPIVEKQERELAGDTKGTVIPVEIRLKHKKGHYIWVNIHSKIFKRNDQGEATMEIGIVVDITKLKESEELFRRIALSANAGIVITQDNKVKFANPQALKMAERSGSHLINVAFSDFIHPSKLTQAKKSIEGLYMGKWNTKRDDLILVSDKGKRIEIETVSSLTSFQGKPAVLSVFLDVSKIKSAEKTFRHIFDESENLIYILNHKNEFIDVNRSVVEKYGYDYEDVIGKTPAFLGAPGKNDMEQVGKFIQQAWEGKTVEFDWWSLKKDGSIFPKEVILKKGHYFDQEVLVANGRDLTSRKKAEEEKNKLIDQLLEQNRDLEQFSYVISHNLRSPVVSILGLAQIFDTEDLNEDNQQVLDHIIHSTKSLDGIIQDLSKTLSVRKHKDDLKETFKPKEVLEMALLSLADPIKLSKATININLENSIDIFSVKGYLQNIFYNLLSNAIKYRNNETPLIIDIDGRMEHDQFQVFVKDNGIGFDLEKIGDKLFRLYERFHHHVEGKGLGLYLVKQQVDALNGTIDVKSTSNKGTLFKVCLPIK